jgi:methyl-accepting chemotaxis protein
MIEHLSLRARIALLTTVLLALLVGEALLSVVVSQRSSDAMIESVTRTHIQSTSATTLLASFDSTSLSISQFLLLAEFANAEEAHKIANAALVDWQSKQAVFAKNADPVALAASLDLQKNLTRFDKLTGKVMVAGLEPSKAVGYWARDSMTDLSRMKISLQSYINKIEELGADQVTAAKAVQQRSRLLLLFTVGLAFGIGFACAFALSRAIERPIKIACKIANRVADGDLSPFAVSGRNDEIGQLLHALSRMRDSLATAIERVRSASNTVLASSSQIENSNNLLGDRAKHQAISLRQTATTMKEMTRIVENNLDSSREAERVSVLARSVADEGGNALLLLVDAIRDISASAKQIAQVTEAIDSIAFQTNILALNAAIEAARSGAHGLGFAVVAGEVRNLAQRSSSSAREIRGLIATGVERADAGGKQADIALRTMQQLIARVKELSGLMVTVAHAADEQKQGIALINIAVAELDNDTQRNLSLMSDSETAIRGLQQEAENLVDAVDAFRF